MTTTVKRDAAYADRSVEAAQLLACPGDGSHPLVPAGAALRCAACGREYPIEDGIVRMLPPTTQSADLAAQEMRARDARASEYDNVIPHYVQVVEREAVMRRLDIRPAQVVLDVGAGTGKVTHAAAAAGAAVLAVDFSVASLAVNRDKADASWRIHFVAADIRELPTRPESFDRVVSTQVIEHLPHPQDRRRAIALMCRALKPGGKLVLTAYNYTLGARIGGAREGLHAGEIFFHRFTARELRGMFDGAQVEELCGIRNLPTFTAGLLGGLSARVDHALERLPCSRLTGDLLLVAARKR